MNQYLNTAVFKKKREKDREGRCKGQSRDDRERCVYPSSTGVCQSVSERKDLKHLPKLFRKAQSKYTCSQCAGLLPEVSESVRILKTRPALT
jgi:hypothetical protein